MLVLLHLCCVRAPRMIEQIFVVSRVLEHSTCVLCAQESDGAQHDGGGGGAALPSDG